MKTTVKTKFNNNALREAITKAVENSEHSITCPNCNCSFSISGSKFGNNVTCPNCNLNIYLDDTGLRQDIQNFRAN